VGLFGGVGGLVFGFGFFGGVCAGEGFLRGLFVHFLF